MPEFILETSYPSRRIIRQTDNSSKYKLEKEFCSIICLDILSGKTTAGNSKHCQNRETSPSHFETSSKTVYVPSRYKFRDRRIIVSLAAVFSIVTQRSGGVGD